MLSDLFDGRSQLLAYHFMFGSGPASTSGTGRTGCSFVADHFDTPSSPTSMVTT